MPATIDQNLAPNAVVEFHTAKDHGKSESEAWAAAVARIRHDVLQMAIATLALGDIELTGAEHITRQKCIAELIELQGDYAGEPDRAL
jgi:hypothetical protein